MHLRHSGNSTRNGNLVGGANGTLNGNWDEKDSSNEQPEETKMLVDMEPVKDTLLETPQESQATSLLPTTTSSPKIQSLQALSDGYTIPTAPSFALTTATITLPSPSMNDTSHQLIPGQPPSSRMSTCSTHSRNSAASATVFRASSTGLSSRPPSVAVAVQVQNAIPRVLIHVRDFAFDKTDERFRGAGALVPRANRLTLLLRKLVGLPDDDDSETDGDAGDAEELDAAWDRLWGRWSSDQNVDNRSCKEVDWNTNDTGRDEEGDGKEEPLYPGLYRAICAFEPEGVTEMALAEDQIVRVVGRGGGVGWAVVVDDSAGVNEDGEPILALVPESFLEAVGLDWEDENGNA